MFNIKDAILAADINEDLIEDDSIEGTDHFYVYLDNGLVLSVLRGQHPNGQYFGTPETGTAEVGVLKVTFAGLRPYNSQDTTTVRQDLDADGLTAVVKEFDAYPPLSFDEILEGAAQVLGL